MHSCSRGTECAMVLYDLKKERILHISFISYLNNVVGANYIDYLDSCAFTFKEIASHNICDKYHMLMCLLTMYM